MRKQDSDKFKYFDIKIYPNQLKIIQLKITN